MIKKLLAPLLILLVVISCKKNANTTPVDKPVNPPVTPGVTQPVSAGNGGSGQPGEVVTFTTTVAIGQDTIHAMIGNNKVVLYKTGPAELTAILPAIPTGTYDVKFSVGTQPYVSKATINAYTPITNAETVATNFTASIDTYKRTFDAINADTAAAATKIDPAELSYLNQMEATFKTEWAKLSATEKMEAAYYLKNVMPSDTLITKLQGNRSPFKLNMNRITIEEAAKGMFRSIGLGVAGGWVLLKVGGVVSKMPGAGIVAAIGGGVALGAALIFLHNKYVAAAKRVAILSQINLDVNSTGASNLIIQSLKTNAVTVPVFTDKQAVILPFKGTYRTLQTNDASSSSTLVSNYVKIDATLEKLWNEIKSAGDGIASFFNLSARLPVYTKGILTTPITSKLTVSSEYLKVQNVSDPEIKVGYEATDSGLKITAQSTTVKTEKAFSFDVQYNNDDFKVQQTFNVSGKYKPFVDSVAILKTKEWNAYEYYKFDPDTRAQSCNLIGNTCLLKSDYYVFLDAGGRVSCESWVYCKYGYDNFRLIFGANMNSAYTGITMDAVAVSAGLAPSCRTGKQYEAESSKKTQNISQGTYRVLNGWLESLSNNVWYRFGKITKLNSTELEIEQYGGVNQLTLTSDYKPSSRTKPGTENTLRGRLKFR